MKKPVYFFASLLVVGLFLNGCGNKKGGVIKCSGEKPDTSVASPPPSSDSIKPHSDIKSQVWIDASYSMKGYVDTKEGSRFYGMIGALGTLKEISGIALFGTSLGDLDSYDSFNKKLENKDIQWCKESNLTSMIKHAVKTSSNSNVFIITDGIMSGSDKQISKERTYNILHRDQLTQEIQSVLNGMNVAINVSQYSLKYRGKYYHYDNSDKFLDEKNRPLYIITVGPKEKVDDVINNTFANNEMLKTNNSLTYGDVNMPFGIKMNISNVNILSREKNTNNYSLNKKYIREQGIDELTFNLGVSMLPGYMKELEYFKKNGHLQSKRLKEGDNAYKDIKVNNIEYNNGKLSITINKSLINQVSLRYVLDYADPAWIKQSSTDDDKLKYSDQTTFNFEYFMKGLSVLNPEGYVNDVENTIINIIN